MQRPMYYLSKAINKFRSMRTFGSPAITGTAYCASGMSVEIIGQSKIILADRVRFGANCGIAVITRESEGEKPAELIIGRGTSFQENLSLNCRTKIEIGANCIISWDVHILDTDFHQLIKENGEEPPIALPIHICDRVWIGERSTILKGVTIGPDSMVAAGSVVTKSFPANSLIGGNPARRIKSIKGWR